MNATRDVIVIGGGITGAGVLRDLALRGFKALLVEKGRPGGQTTRASTHLIHGGLRYLLYDRLTTHTTCWDSGNIVRIAGNLLTRLPIVWPVYLWHRHGLETVETLLESYDSFQRMKLGLPHLRLSAAQTARLFPGLETDGLRGSLVFDEWWVDAQRLVEANLESALRAGAQARLETSVVGLARGGGAVTGVEIETSSGSRETIPARLVINAAGPWVGRVAAMAGLSVAMRLQKGTHLIYDGQLPFLGAPGLRAGLLLEAEDRERYVFVIPGGDRTLVGPTDLAGGQDPDRIATAPEEVGYLLRSARLYFKDFPERFDRTIVGARPILGQRGSEKLLSREYEVFDHAERDKTPGLLTVGGGKMSDFRLMGQDAGEAARRILGKGSECRTHLLSLSGKPTGELPVWPRPWRPLKSFLRRHPRLRELHALAYLGAGLARHAWRRLSKTAEEGSLEDFERRYRGP